MRHPTSIFTYFDLLIIFKIFIDLHLEAQHEKEVNIRISRLNSANILAKNPIEKKNLALNIT